MSSLLGSFAVFRRRNSRLSISGTDCGLDGCFPFVILFIARSFAGSSFDSENGALRFQGAPSFPTISLN